MRVIRCFGAALLLAAAACSSAADPVLPDTPSASTAAPTPAPGSTQPFTTTTAPSQITASTESSNPTTSSASSTTTSSPLESPEPTSAAVCGHDIDPAIVALGYNEVIDRDGAVKEPQGRPLQEGDRLRATADRVLDANRVVYAQIASFMMPIRDALMCDLDQFTEPAWLELTEILTLNGIKTEQDLSGSPPEQVYSTAGIFEYLRAGEGFHAMMKFLEEAELELKCLAFENFNFTNPEGDNHCEIHGLIEGSGLQLP